MKTEFNEFGIYLDFDAKDVAKMLSKFTFMKTEDFVNVFESLTYDFSAWDISDRQRMVESLLRKHLCSKQYQEVLKLLASFDDGVWK